jgi:hypothetical protein
MVGAQRGPTCDSGLYAMGAMGSLSRLQQAGMRISRQLGLGIAKVKAIPRAAGQWLDDHREEIFAAMDKLERLTRHMTSRFLPPAETGALTSAGWTPFAWSLEASAPPTVPRTGLASMTLPSPCTTRRSSCAGPT